MKTLSKSILTSIIIILVFNAGMAQFVSGFNYQAVVRNSDGTIMKNTPVSLRATILTLTVKFNNIQIINDIRFSKVQNCHYTINFIIEVIVFAILSCCLTWLIFSRRQIFNRLEIHSLEDIRS